MLETLLELDLSLFQFINQQLHTPLLDLVLPYWREKTTWIPFYLLIFAYALWKHHWQGLLIIVMLSASVGLADTVSSKIIKKQIERPRPCNDPDVRDEVQLLIDCGSGYSFTSSHATNHFAVAIFIILLWGKRFRWLKPVVLIWAALIAFSQVYVGVHYPLDVIAGTLLGIMIGSLGFYCYNLLSRILKPPTYA